MKILVTGGTGTVGREVVKVLLQRGAEIRVLARNTPEKGVLPNHVEIATGDLLNPVSIEQAMRGVDKLFLLNAVVADELTQALIAYGLANRMQLKHVTYLSVFRVEEFPDVPHFASKLAVERVLREFGPPFTILRPSYYMQNDLSLEPLLTGPGVYPVPIGTAGISAVDIRDIAEAAATTLTQNGHEGKTYDLVGPTLIDGPGVAALWSKLLGKNVRYGGQDFDRWEQEMRSHVAAWMAFDLRTMYQAYFDRGFASTTSQVARLTELLGHPPRSYAEFATDAARRWRAAA